MRLWQTLPQSTKLLLATLLFVFAVALWYALFFYLPLRQPQSGYAPAPGAPQAPPTQPGTPQGGTPKAIEAPPVPFMAEPGPKTPNEGQKAQTAPQTPEPLPAPLSAQGAAEPLPNPFVPLRVATPQTPLSSPSAPMPPPPLPRGAPVRVSPGSPLPTPTPAPVSRERATSRRLGTPLPLPQVVEAPLGLPPLPEAPFPSDVPVGKQGTRKASLPLQETLVIPQAESAPEGTMGKGPRGETPPLTPLQAFVAEKGLRLSGVILGPVSVVILGSKGGYQVLPVGDSLPGSEVVIRSATAESVELALKDETLTLNLDRSNGGER